MTRDKNHSRNETDERPTHYLREWREFMGWSQEELGEMVDVHQTKIARVETGKRELRAGFLKDLARVFRVLPSALLEVNPATKDGEQTASMLLAWNGLTNSQRNDMLRMMNALSRANDDSDVG